MGLGAVHPNGTNFRRFPARFNIVDRMRRLIDNQSYDRPRWMDSVERAPPLNLHELQLQSHRVRNPYPELVREVLSKYPSLRFQDLYVEGNEWRVGVDRYRDDHPIMQFVSRQLQLINSGLSRYRAFKQTESEFREKRMELEKKQKITMAMAFGEHVAPVHTTAQAYWLTEVANSQARHLVRIRNILRCLRRRKLSDMGKVTPQLFPRLDGTTTTKMNRRVAAFEIDETKATLNSDMKTEISPNTKGISNFSLPLNPIHTRNEAATSDPLYYTRNALCIDGVEKTEKPALREKLTIETDTIMTDQEDSLDVPEQDPF